MQTAPPPTLVGPGTPGRLYALQTAWTGAKTARLLTSDDLGTTWRPFGGLPVDSACLRSVDLDYATADALYASTCRGIQRWDGRRWAPLSPLATLSVAVAYGKPSALLAVAQGAASGVVVLRSDDGGQTWQDGGLGGDGTLDVAIDPHDPAVAYALPGFKSFWYTLCRGAARPGRWAQLPSPFPTVVAPLIHGMTVAGADGALYVAARNTDQPAPPWGWLSASTPQVWRTPNPGAPKPQDVPWELVHDFGGNLDARLLASATGPQGTILFANLGLAPEQLNVAPVVYRSRDGGRSWEPIAVPSG